MDRQLARPGRLLDLTGDLQVALELEQGFQAGAHRLLRERQALDLAMPVATGASGSRSPAAIRSLRATRASIGTATRRAVARALARAMPGRSRSGRARPRGVRCDRRRGPPAGNEHRHDLLSSAGQGEGAHSPHQAAPEAVKRSGSAAASGSASVSARRASSNSATPRSRGRRRKMSAAGAPPGFGRRPGPGDETRLAVEHPDHRAGRDLERGEMVEQVVQHELDQDDAPAAVRAGEPARDGESLAIGEAAAFRSSSASRRGLRRLGRGPPGLLSWIEGAPGCRRLGGDLAGSDHHLLPAARRAAQRDPPAVVGEDSEGPDPDGFGSIHGSRQPPQARRRPGVERGPGS